MATLIEEMDRIRGSFRFPERVVGIDPGLNVTGYAVVEPSPHGPFVIEAGVIRPRSARKALGQRLAWIHRGIVEVLEAFPPGSVALEQVHSHVSYPRTAILMAHARGAIMLAAAAAADAGLRLRRHPDQEDPHRQRPGPQGSDPARDHDRTRPGPAPRAQRRRRRLRRRPLPFLRQPKPARSGPGLN